MPNLEVHYRHHTKRLENGGKMSSLTEDFGWLGITLQMAISNAYKGVNGRPVNPSSVLVRFIEASKWDVGIDDVVFVIKCGRNGLSDENQLKFCDIFDKTRIRGDVSLSDWLHEKGASHSVEMFNYESHGFGKSPNRSKDNIFYVF